MATLTKANPRVVAGHMETTSLLIANGTSWQAGQFLHTVSGALTVSATSAVNFKYYALTTQADPGNATTYAEVGVITNDLVFEGNEVDATSAVATWKGLFCGIEVTSNIVTVDTGEVTNTSVVVEDVGFLYEPLKNNATETYPLVKFRVAQSTLDAAGS